MDAKHQLTWRRAEHREIISTVLATHHQPIAPRTSLDKAPKTGE